MIQGTGSDVGKSLLVAGLARAFAQDGLKVRPFKPQNMSNNAAVTADGREIGRAQALQARAAFAEPESDMNPILLKPQSDVGAQVIVHGKVTGNATAKDYHGLKATLMGPVLESFGRLASGADLVLVEGAGSPAEVNLREGDIANMGFANAADVPVLLVADVARGGALASIVGTWTLLSDADKACLRGYVINKFRGDPRLFDGAIDIIGTHTGLHCFGVVPHFSEAASLPAEDAMALEDVGVAATARGRIHIVVPRLARIANFDDLDPLTAEPDVTVSVVDGGNPLPRDADLILLPGSKSTLADLAYLREQGWDVDMAAARRQGTRIFGICAGYQMLGRSVADPDGLEGPPGHVPGLGMLDVETVIGGEKTLTPVSGTDRLLGADVRGYEMHMGQTTGADCARPLLDLVGDSGSRLEGARSADGRVWGTAVHGLFAADGFRHGLLKSLAPARRATVDYEAGVEAALNGLADHLRRHLDLPRLLTLANSRRQDGDKPDSGEEKATGDNE
ncbi:MAG: cobyric acid synthase [Alphaproteobacteria bacterium]